MIDKKELILQHIIDISNKLVNGEIENIDLSFIENEINTLADNFQQLIANFTQLGDNLYHSTNEMPILTQHLEHISETTAQGVIQVMENAEGIMSSASELSAKVIEFKEKYNDESMNDDIDEINNYAMDIQNRAFGIMTSLEFEDINRQQIEKILKALTDFQDQFYKLLSLLKLKDYIERKEHKSNIMDELRQVVDLRESNQNKQDLIDELFREFGL